MTITNSTRHTAIPKPKATPKKRGKKASAENGEEGEAAASPAKKARTPVKKSKSPAKVKGEGIEHEEMA